MEPREPEAEGSRPSILITGANGGLARMLAESLKDRYHVVGVDPRRPRAGAAPFPGEFHRINYTHRRMEDVFRATRFEALLHMGRVRVTSGVKDQVRYTLNVLGTRNLLTLARKHGVGKVIVFSTFHVYGAHNANHLHITEDEPLRASQGFPELSDSVELDHYAKTFSLQYPEIKTIILRPVNVIGRKMSNTISLLLRSKLCPTLLGYDPMLQFIHEDDVVRALRLCLDSGRSGVYNIAGEGMLPYTRAIELAGSTALPIPHFLAYPLVQALVPNTWFPRYLMDYFRYPTIVSDSAFRRDFGFQPSMTTVEALKSLQEPYPG